MDSLTAVVVCMTDSERPFLAGALRSVQRQTIPVHAVLCVEENNAWVDELLGDLEPGVTLLRLPMARLGMVRNMAVRTVTTEFTAFLDGDDSWMPDKSRHQIAYLTRNNLDIVAAKHVLIREDGKQYFYGFAQSVPMPSSWLARTSILRDMPFEDVMIGEDVILWRRVQAEVRWGVVPRFLIRYCVRGSSLSSTTWSKERKLAFARRSQMPGMRPVLLTVSYAVHLVLVGRDKALGVVNAARADWTDRAHGGGR